MSAGEDDDAIRDSADIDLSAAGGGFTGTAGSVEVAVTDNDAELILSPTTLTVNEGGTGTFSVELKGQPSATVTVTLARPANRDVTLDTDPNTAGDQNRLTFMTDDWDEAQTVTVTAGQDDDSNDDDAEIRLSAAGGGFGSTAASLDVSITDDDDPALTLSETSLTIDEGGSGSFTVQPNGRPSAPITVALSQPGTGNADVTFSPASLSFTALELEHGPQRHRARRRGRRRRRGQGGHHPDRLRRGLRPASPATSASPSPMTTPGC